MGTKLKKPLFDHLFLAAPELEQQFFADDKGGETKINTKAGEILMSNPQAGAAVSKAFRKVHILFDPADHVLRKVTNQSVSQSVSQLVSNPLPPTHTPHPHSFPPRSTYRMPLMLVSRVKVLCVGSF